MSSSTASSPAQRGNGARPSWLAFFMEEWGLLLLAATMTFGSWWIVRESVVKAHRIDNIRVVLEIDERVRDRIGAVFEELDPRISIVLNCSEREKNEAISALKRTGVRQVTLRILGEPVSETRNFEPGTDVFDWPFDDERILDQNSVDPPAIKVFRVQPRKVRIEKPETVRTPEELRAELNVRVDIDVPDAEFTIPAPRRQFDTPVRPDPIAIDANDFRLREDGTYEGPRTINLTFRGWRESPELETWERAYRRDLSLEGIKARVSLILVGDESFSNRLLVLADEGRYEFDFKDLRDEQRVSRVGPLTFEGKLRGPKTVLDELATDESKRAWVWGIRLKQELDTEFKREDAQPDADGWLSLDAQIVWLPFGDFQNRGVTFRPEGFEKEFTYQVRVRPTEK